MQKNQYIYLMLVFDHQCASNKVTRRTVTDIFERTFFKKTIFRWVNIWAYPSGSQHSRLYGTPEVHKIKSNSEVPSFRPIVFSLDSFNYNLTRFLSDTLIPFIPTDYCSQDSFSFLKGNHRMSVLDYFVKSFDVWSLFANMLHCTKNEVFH